MIVMLVLLFIISVYLYIDLQDRNRQLSEAKMSISSLRAELDSLESIQYSPDRTREQDERLSVRETSPLTSFETRMLQQKGLANPVEDLKRDLLNRDDLIDHDGVLGGTMRFSSPDEIRILNSRWVLAFFEDGHIRGTMLLEYDVLREGEIDWKVLASIVD